MSDTRYQVFVSSTFSDLKEERARVSQALMEMSCIPAGMELFPATDEEQFSFIKTVIDESDYYLLIIGGRYGTVSSEGVSFTEKEYDYASSRGLEICAFIHSNPNCIPSGKSEASEDLRKSLERFKEKVSTGRLVKYWADPKELPGQVVISLNSAIRRKPAIGWVRGNREAPPETLNELVSLREENNRLKAQLKAKGSGDQDRLISDLNKIINLDYRKSIPLIQRISPGLLGSDSTPSSHHFSISLAEIVKKIGYEYLEPAPLKDLTKLIPEANKGVYGLGITSNLAPHLELTISSSEKIRIALTATGILLESSPGLFTLGPQGKRALFEIATQED
ncbi:DUF4062 domain-containing protein [Mesorhizobium sp. LNJC403B00]|uniref:DUF4062 domain-containing protein n=1 Tax=Mesorhizobium sp. LNJC403B00 TaxID=1287280 RepID=UPI0009FDFE06|nr:DUF4062 domain-containing protein [Mesorhizobium sp. LNJC403B00]